MKKIAILASGDKVGGGSGFEKLVEASIRGDLDAEIVCVLSNHPSGGVRERAERLGVRFEYFGAPWTAERCLNLIREDVDLICMSGWLKQVIGLDPAKTINIHPGPIPRFGGPGMYGHYVHEAVMKAYREGTVTHSEVTMHFVTDEYDKGPVFFKFPIIIEENDTPVSLGRRVNAAEHEHQWRITQQVLEGKISWDGTHPESLECRS